MPYDPTIPTNGTLVDADELRTQLNGLKELIDGLTDRVTNLETELGNVNTALANCLTQADLEPIAANNIDGVAELSLALSDPPETIEILHILDKLNEAIAGLHR